MNPYERYKNFTEGPLKAVNDDQITPQFTLKFYAVQDSKGDNILRLNGALNGKANAELFAAAPLLLQDCREMWEELSEIAEIFEENKFHGSAMEVRSLLNRIKDRHK